VNGDLSILTEAEASELVEIAEKYLRSRSEGRFQESDVWRAELMEWGAWPPEYGWHPVFESAAHRHGRHLRRQDDR
jgi:hypothetical protein